MTAPVDDVARSEALLTAVGFSLIPLAQPIAGAWDLLAVSPRAEPTVRQKLAPLAARGVSLHTIYAGLPGSILEGWS